MATNAVPEAQCSPNILKKLDYVDPKAPEPIKLTIPQRQELLLATLKKDGGLDSLKEWPPEWAQKAMALLLEFHHIFSLEPNEIGCMDATEHVIKLLKEEPFKERFWCIVPPLVEEVHQHIQEILDALIEGLEDILSQKQDDGHYHLVAYASWGLKGVELKYHSSKLEFLALKWAMTDQFKEYLQYQPFLVKTNNSPLTYVMTTPNLDTVGHRWVAAMVGYNFEIKYVCGAKNNVADDLSLVGGHLDEDTVKELLSHATHLGVPRAEANDPRVVEEHDKTEGEVIMQAHMLAETKKNYRNLADSHWLVAQHGNLAICLVM